MTRPFCPDSRARAAFDRWRQLVQASGAPVSEADEYVLGVAANCTARLEGLAESRAKEKDPSVRLRLLKAERDVAIEMSRVLEQVSRTFAVEVDAADVAPAVSRTGTDNVVSFPERPRSRAGQRVAAVVASADEPLTLAQLRKKVRGNEPDFRAGVKEALRSRVMKRVGPGRKGTPYQYVRGET